MSEDFAGIDFGNATTEEMLKAGFKVKKKTSFTLEES